MYKYRGEDYYLDTPIMTCKKCKQKFVDSRFKEYISMDDAERKSYFSQYKTGILPILLIIFFIAVSIIVGVTAKYPANLIFPIIGGIIVFVSLIQLIVRNKRIKKYCYDSTIKKSLNRCMNREYLISLVYAGFDLILIPSRELSNNPEFKMINDLVRSVNVDEIKKSIKRTKEEHLNANIEKLKNLGAFDSTIDNNSLSFYDSLKSLCKENNDIVALYFDAENNVNKFVKLKIGFQDSINRYLVDSSGFANKIIIDGITFWYLESSVKRRALLFRVKSSGEYKSVEEKDLERCSNFIDKL